MINRFSEQWPSQPWINRWSRWLDGAVNWLLFIIKGLFFFLKACLASLFSKTPKRRDSPFSLFIAICLWLWSAGSQSSGSTGTEWETLCPRTSATVEEPLSSCSSGVAQWHKQLKTVMFSGQRPSVNIQYTTTVQSKSEWKKGHVCSLNFHWKGQKINNTINCRMVSSRAF